MNTVWFLLFFGVNVYADTGAAASMGSLVAGTPKVFSSERECRAAMSDRRDVEKLFAGDKPAKQDVAAMCVAGVVHRFYKAK